jgi:hypothetical protein
VEPFARISLRDPGMGEARVLELGKYREKPKEEDVDAFGLRLKDILHYHFSIYHVL